MRKLKLFFACLLMAVLSIGQVWATKATLDYSALGYTKTTALNGVELDADANVSITLATNGGSTAPSYYTTGTGARTYGSNTITVDAGSGTITQIDFDFTQNNKDYSVSAGTYSKANSQWTGSANSVVFTTASGSGHNRIRSITVTYSVPGGKQDAGLEYAAADSKKLAILGETFTAPTLTNPNGLTISYESDDEDVAEVANDGSVTIKAAGKAVITASSEETTTYNAGSASYTICVTNHAGTEADPFDVADARNVIDVFETMAGVYATGTVSAIVTAYNSQFGNITYNFSADGETTSDQLQAYRGKDKDGEWFTSADDVQVGDVVVVYGNLKKHNSTYEFDTDNQLYSVSREKQASGIAYATTAYIVKKGDDSFTAPTLTNPNNLTVTYSSSDEDVAVVGENTGEIALETSAAGVSVEITATFAGNGSYNAGTAKYVIYVAEHAGTAADPLTVADAKGLIDGISTMDNVFVKGIINEVSSFSDQYSSITYWISDNGEDKDLQVYSGKGLNGADFSAIGDLQVADEVVVVGTLKKYNSTYEFDKNNYLSSLVRKQDAELAYVETAIEKVIGDEDFTNPLTNPNGLTVTYSDDDLALVDENSGLVVLGTQEGTVTITATFAGNDTYKADAVSYTITITEAPLTDYYEKVTSGDVAEGTYLIVYEAGNVAFDGSLETLDATSNTITVGITADHKIGVTQETAASTFYIDPVAGTIQAKSGKYIGHGSDANGLTASDNALTNTLSIDGDGNAVIVAEGGAYLRYNSNSGQERFRYFKSASYTNQKAIQLYKLANEVVKQAAGLAYTDADALVVKGTEFTKPTLANENNLDVTYESDNTDVAEVANDGSVTIKAAGKAKITASSEETTEYKAGSASYTIYVVNHAGTQADPYDVADARRVIDWNVGVTDVYVAGIVSEATTFNSEDGWYTYNISADGLTTSNQLQVYKGKGISAAAFTSENDIKVGDEVVVTGNLTKYNSTYEFAASNQLVSLSRDKQPAGLVYATTELDSSSDENLATVDENGEVTIKNEAGTVTITATFTGDFDYLPGSASYTITINDPTLIKVTFDATVDTETFTKNNITLECSNGVLDNESEYRLYKNSVTTLSCSDGNIKRIEFIGKSGNPASGFATQAGWTTNGNDGTWTGNAASVTFEATGAQVRATKINVYYKADTRADANLAWDPADDIELTVGDAFSAPALVKPNDITVANITIASDNPDLATVNEGVVSLVANATGEATITATFTGDEKYKPAMVSYNITVNAAPVVPTAIYNKVPSGAYLTSGEYLIVYENGSVAFNGALEGLDAVSNTVAVTINNDQIEGSTTIDAATFTIDVAAGTIKSASNKYIGQGSDANGLTASDEALENTLSIDADGNFVAVSDGGAYLRYNSTSGQERFRYFKSSSYTNQKAVQLYKKGDLEFATYTRNVTDGNYGTICLPYAGTISGAALYKTSYRANGIIYCDEILSGELEAGKPYIFKANSDKLNVTYTAATAETAADENGLYGYYDLAKPTETFDILEDAGNYVLYQNQYWLVSGREAYIANYRAYIKLDEISTSAPTLAPGVRRVAMTVHGEQTATGIGELNASETPVKMIIDGQLFIIRGEKMFDATGRLVK